MPAEPRLDLLIQGIESSEAGPRERLGAAADLAGQLRRQADELVDHFVQGARNAGASWTEIGGALGVSKQAAQQRFVQTEKAWPGGIDDAAGEAFAAGARVARELGHHYIAPEHLVLGLLDQTEELAARALGELGVTHAALRRAVVEQLGEGPPRPRGSLGVAPQTKRLLELARTLAKRLGHRCARTEHILLAAVSPKLRSPAASALAKCGAEGQRVCDQIASMLEIEAPELAARMRRGLRRRSRL